MAAVKKGHERVPNSEAAESRRSAMETNYPYGRYTLPRVPGDAH